MTNNESPTILSVVSGKGGVGKTALSLSIAYELSAAGNKVVVIDFDFYNRGLSELVAEYGHSTEQKINPEQIFAPNEQTSEPWSILEIGDRIQTVKIPPLEPRTLQSIESCSFEKVRCFVHALTKSTLDTTGANVAVLDCHGGRDVVSYAAASVSDHVFVVSVPETITFFGTIRFVEGFKEANASISAKPRLHVVFNYVMEGFSRKVLSYWYGKYFRQHFDDEDFLSLIPFDSSVSIATSKELFPTKKLLYSPMAEKTRLLIHDTLKDNNHVNITAETNFVSKVLRPFIRARRPTISFVVDEKIPLRFLIASLLIIFSGLLAVDLMQVFGFIEVEISWLLDWFDYIVLSIFGYVSFIVFASLWLIISFIGRSIINQDAVVSGEFGKASWEDIGKTIYRTASVLLGIILISIMSFEDSIMLTDNDMEILTSFFGPISKQVINTVQIMETSIKTVATIICVIFSVIFMIRSVRTISFRTWSGESLYRLVVLVGFVAFWYLLSE